jgi:hypothetical protein
MLRLHQQLPDAIPMHPQFPNTTSSSIFYKFLFGSWDCVTGLSYFWDAYYCAFLVTEPVLPWDNKSRCHHNSTTTTPNTIPTFCTLSVSVFSAFAPLILLSLVREFESSRVRDLSLHPQRLPKPKRHRHTPFLMLCSSTLINYFGFGAALLGFSRFAPIFATRCFSS